MRALIQTQTTPAVPVQQTESEKKLQIMKDKFHDALERSKEDNEAAIDAVLADLEDITDYLIPVGKGVLRRPVFSSVNNNGSVGISFKEKEGGPLNEFLFHPHAEGQLAERFDIPAKYLRKLLRAGDWGHTLLDETLNAHAAWTPKRRMLVRTVRDKVRGWLSDAYMRINSAVVYKDYLHALRELGAVIWKVHHEDTRVYIDAVYPQVFAVPTKNNGIRYVLFGSHLRTSDFGDGALEYREFWFEVTCSNGSIGKSLLRKAHIGARLDERGIAYSQKTYELQTAAMASAVKDIVHTCFTPEYIERKIEQIKSASEKMIDVDRQMERLPKMCTKSEIEAIRKEMMQSDPSHGVTGETTMLKLHAAITWVAGQQQVRRMREMQELAARVCKLD